MKYCVRCISPDSRPNLKIGADGICNACVSHASRPTIDWSARAEAFSDVVTSARARARRYDCLIPVSGGKDSTWQVMVCLEAGLKPLAVTWRPQSRTAIGQKNLDNLIALGVDHIDYQISPAVERKFLYEALTRFGAAAIPMHMAMFNIPLRLAVSFDIPLVVWGENSAFEYGGTDNERQGFKLNDHWLRTFGVTHGTTARDWVSADLTERDLTPYFGPTEAELDAKGVLAVFLGYYFPWDPETSLKAATAAGFQPRAEGPKTGYYDFADIDDDFISVHHYVKWHKFGFTRSYDNLSLEIRNGRMTRDDAIAWLRRRGDERPHEDIATLCRFLGITESHFDEIIERFRNPAIWTRRDGRWVIDDFLIPDWAW